MSTPVRRLSGTSRRGTPPKNLKAAWIGNQHSRATTLSPDRVEQLSVIGMRWT
ncbi:hypothetical protein AB0D11_48205 [Streptomyces monashensis]|uniref:hypothetical protein n=1 Tax=Streptomyces monashensis TaxID=1678012 RepID=UPI0033ECDE34